MAGVCDTRDLQFTVRQPHSLHINLCQVITFDQGSVIRYFDEVLVTFVGTLGPLLSPNKTTLRNLVSQHTKFVNKSQVWGSCSGIAIDPSVIYRSHVRYVARGSYRDRNGFVQSYWHVNYIELIPFGCGVKDFGLRPFACWDCGFESRRGHGYLSDVRVVCWKVEVSASGLSLV